MKLPTLPPGAAYLRLAPDPAKGNVLSQHILHDLHSQLTAHLQPPAASDSAPDPQRPTHVLPPFQPQYLTKLEQALENPGSADPSIARFAWLVHGPSWRRFRAHNRPKVLVLRPETPGLFASSHGLDSAPSSAARRDLASILTMALGGITTLMRSSPIPIVAPVEDPVTGAAACALVLAADYPIAMADTAFQLAGPHPSHTTTIAATLAATLAATALAHRGVPQPLAYRMMTLGEPVTAEQLGGNGGGGGGGVVDAVAVPEHAESTDTRARALEARVDEVVQRLVRVAGQAHALSKWAFWTAGGMGWWREAAVDGEGGVVEWMARVAALQARVEEQAGEEEEEEEGSE